MILTKKNMFQNQSLTVFNADFTVKFSVSFPKRAISSIQIGLT